ncbi:MAG TPA: tetratricopeptide repeat protein [Kiritimatiellia bacterium]|nr:tetratricopeptide repeat protein [Kiritimatiellia bacterium]HRZ11800.1 tetratricopeptide repeat protein [Kiritimatiellia bacterium]HSA17394.1 tetratricopeptide repeat protein [Kiritimatiellia bacterium]
MQIVRRFARSEAAWLGIILLAALVLRVLYLAEARRDPSFAMPASDAAFHDYWARALVTGDWTPPPETPDPRVPSTPFFRPPGYPYFLAAAYRILGGRYMAPRILQMGLGILNVLLAFRLGRKMFDSAAGLVFAALMAVYWSFIYFEAEFLEPVLLVTLGLLMVLLLASWLQSPRVWMAAAAGLCLGLYALTRPNVLVFAAALPLWMLWITHRRRGEKRIRWLHFGLLAAVALATILPATIRNYRRGHDRVLICSNGGINLYIGNNPAANGIFVEPPELRPFRSVFDWPALVKRLEGEAGRPLRHSQVSSMLTRAAARFAWRYPRRALELAGRKTLLFWGPVEVGNNKEDHWERHFSPLLRRLPGNFTAALALALVGFWLWRRRPAAPAGSRAGAAESVALILLLVLSLFASYLPFFVAGRFRAPIVPFLLLFAAYALSEWWKLFREQRMREAVPGLAAAVILYLVLGVNWAGHRPQEADYHYFRGLAFERLGQTQPAMSELVLAIRQRPGHAPTLKLLGGLLLNIQRPEEAVECLDAAARLLPDDAKVRHLRGVALARTGRLPEARAEFEEALRLHPGNADVLFNLGMTLARMGEFARADEILALGLAAAPDRTDLLVTRAMVAWKQGRAREALDLVGKADRLKPGDPEILNQRAWMLAVAPEPSDRRPEEAIRLAAEACRLIGRDHPPFLDTQAAALAAAGRFEEAAQTARRALELGAGSPEEFQREVQERLALYQAGRAYVEPAR